MQRDNSPPHSADVARHTDLRYFSEVKVTMWKYNVLKLGLVKRDGNSHLNEQNSRFGIVHFMTQMFK